MDQQPNLITPGGLRVMEVIVDNMLEMLLPDGASQEDPRYLMARSIINWLKDQDRDEEAIDLDFGSLDLSELFEHESLMEMWSDGIEAAHQEGTYKNVATVPFSLAGLKSEAKESPVWIGIWAQLEACLQDGFMLELVIVKAMGPGPISYGLSVQLRFP